MTLSIKKFNELRDAVEDAESALFGCEQLDWESFEELFEDCPDNVVLRPRITCGEFRRLKKTLDRLNYIVNTKDYDRIR